MTIVITGGSGFVGQELILLLTQLGYDVVNIDIDKSLHPVREIIHDLTLPMKPIKNLEKFDVCIHLASGAGGILYNQQSNIIGYNNAINANVAAICKCDPLLIFVSSINVFENSQSNLNVTPNAPENMYARSKWNGEIFFQSRINNLKILRPSNIFGKSQISHFTKYGESHVIPDLLQKIKLSNDNIDVWGDGTQIRNFIHVRDLCHIIHSTIVLNEHLPKSINAISSIQPTIAELAKDLISYSGKNLGIKFSPEYMQYEKVPYKDIFSQVKICGSIKSIREGLAI